MMRLPCPFCGMRDEPEFQCGGTTNIVRPGLDSSDQVWGSYLHFRINPKGAHFERWRHTFGCGQWFNLVRNTVTHEVTSFYLMSESPP
jgi:sarcosine oxidase, subunit delta